MISSIVSRLVILVFGTLYPAYASYKAVRTKNVKEYVKWMMYWIVFALFTCAETFTDIFFSFWFPFYYEIKIILVLWLLSPATKGSSTLYRRFVHPALIRREADIDEALARATEQGYTAVLHLGTKGVNYATTVLMQTAIRNLSNVVPSTVNALPSSQSAWANSSSARPRAVPMLESAKRKDRHDGVATARWQAPPTPCPYSEDDLTTELVTDVHDQTTDEDTEEESSEGASTIEKDSPPIFKRPAEQIVKPRKPRKDRAGLTPGLKSEEIDFSDEVELD